jgi:hypothetical protein
MLGGVKPVRLTAGLPFFSWRWMPSTMWSVTWMPASPRLHETLSLLEWLPVASKIL